MSKATPTSKFDYIDRLKSAPLEPLRVSSLTEYIDAIGAIDYFRLKVYYRGQANADWELESSAYRYYRGRNNRISQEYFAEQLRIHNVNLVRDIKKMDPTKDIQDYILRNDLHVLAYCQHHGAKTNLLDFSQSPLVALWFACADEKHLKKDAMVACLEDDFETVDEKKNLSELLVPYVKELLPPIFVPPLFDRRMLAQQSILALLPMGKMPKHEYRRIIVSADAKKEILDNLKMLGITKATIYPDASGFFDWYKTDACNAMNELMAEAKELSKKREFEDSKNAYLKCEEFASKHFGKDDVRLSTIWAWIGEQYSDLNRYPDAIKCHLKAMKIRRKFWGEEHVETAKSYSSLGVNYRSNDQLKESLAYHEKARTIREGALGRLHSDTTITYNNLAFYYYYIEEYEQAVKYNEAALHARMEMYGRRHRSVAWSHNNLGYALRDAGRLEEAEEHLNAAMTLRKEIFGTSSREYAGTLRELGQLCLIKGRIDEAAEKFHAAEKAYGGHTNTKDDVSRCLLCLGEAYLAKKDFDASEKCLTEALNLRKELPEGNRSRLADIHFSFAKLRAETSRAAEAAEHIEIAFDIYKKYFGKASNKTKRAMAFRDSLRTV